MKIQIHPSLILWLSVLFYLSPGLLLPFFGAVCVHEGGHYLMLVFLKKPPVSLTLSFSGGAMEIGALSYKEEVLAAISGPISSLILATFWPIFPKLCLYSLVLGLVNMIPVPGLDGYRILRGLSYSKLEPGQAGRMTVCISSLFELFLITASCYFSIRFSLGCWPMVLVAMFLIRSLRQGC